jgi:voltage-gated potassium channel
MQPDGRVRDVEQQHDQRDAQRTERATDTAKAAADALQEQPAARVKARAEVAEYLDLPAALASFLVLLLIGLQLSGRVQPAWWNGSATVMWLVWAAFILEYALKLALSPDKPEYVSSHRRQLLTAIFPCIGVVRLFGPLRNLLIALIHLLLPVSPEAGPYIAALKKRKLGRLALISAVVILIAGTVEYFFESGTPDSPINSFGAAIWWSAATATTVANQLYPVTAGGQVVAFLVMVYAVCVFGYLASSLASVLVAGDAQKTVVEDAGGGSDASRKQPPQPADGNLQLTDGEIRVLRRILERLQQQ